jgi:hypothetical protein
MGRSLQKVGLQPQYMKKRCNKEVHGFCIPCILGLGDGVAVLTLPPMSVELAALTQVEPLALLSLAAVQQPTGMVQLPRTQVEVTPPI